MTTNSLRLACTVAAWARVVTVRSLQPRQWVQKLLAAHRLHIVGVDVQARLCDKLDRVCIPLKVWHKSLHEQPAMSSLLQLLYCRRNVRCSSIGQVISVNTGQDHIVDAPCRHSLHRCTHVMITGVGFCSSARSNVANKLKTLTQVSAHI